MRAALRVLAVLALLVMSGITVQARAENIERRAYPPPGQLVDIGGGQLIHIRRWEPAVRNDGPTIVLDVSAAMPLSEWAWVGRGLAEAGHSVVAYDRPGMAWSRGPWQPRDAGHAADALHKALSKAGIEPPFVVVGHSYGGFSARVFTGRYRADIAALILLDTTHGEGGGEQGFATFYRVRAWQAHAGLFHLERPSYSGLWALPEEERAAADAVSLWTSHLDTSAEELEAWHTSVQQIRALGGHGDLPLLVVCANDSRPQHVALQRDLATLSSNSRFVELNVDHMGMLVVREQAALVVAEMNGFLAGL